MKKILFSTLVLCMSLAAFAQLNPVSWTFTSKKLADKTYEIHLVATIQSGWHVYSQSQPSDAVAQPTVVTFSKNPLVTLDGKVAENGALEKMHDPKLDVSAHQYSNKVEFVQKIKLKSAAKTTVSGAVKFQTCNDERCLPARTVNFSVAL